MLLNLVELGGAGTSVAGVAGSPAKLLGLVLQRAQSTFALALVALILASFRSRGSRPTIFQLSVLSELPIVLMVMADSGTDYNHLMDMVVLMPIATFDLTKNLAWDSVGARVARSLIIVAVLVGSSVALISNASSEVTEVIAEGFERPAAALPPEFDPRPFGSELGSARTVLSEDPYVSLSRGDRPIVIDAFMFHRIARQHPQLAEPLRADVERESFDAIVLTEDLDLPHTLEWFRDVQFGLPIYLAMKDHYRLCARAGPYTMYAPLSRACPISRR